MICPDVTGVSSTVSAQALGHVQPVSTNNSLSQSSMSYFVNDCAVNKIDGGLAALHAVTGSAAPNPLHTLRSLLLQWISEYAVPVA